MRSTLLACAAAMFVAAGAVASAEAPSAQSCADTSFRVYFAPGSAALNATAREMIAVAQRNAATCSYAALDVAVDPSTSLARQRGQAVLAAMHGRSWNETRIAARGSMHAVSLSDGPEYAQVTVANHPLAPAPTLTDRSDAGV